MAQPSKRNNKVKVVARKKKLSVSEVIKRSIERSKKPHPKYGTSKLEIIFETEILKKLNIQYEKQFYARDIKRYYDFYLPKLNVLIEIDGDYW